jgi:peptide/nickel transport system permease protein
MKSLARRALRHPSFVVGASLSLLLAAAALLSLVWAPYPPAEIDIPQAAGAQRRALAGHRQPGPRHRQPAAGGRAEQHRGGRGGGGHRPGVGVALGCLAAARAAGWKS